LSGSTEHSSSSPGSSVGRTKYDLLHEMRWVAFAGLAVVLIVVFLFFNGMPSVNLSGIEAAVNEWWPLFVAFLAGVYTFHKMYWRWIVRGVILQKENSPMMAFFVTKGRFERIPDSDKVVPSNYTQRGTPVYRCRSIDLLANTVVFGRQHLTGMSLGEVMTFPDRYDKMLEEYQVSEFERNELKDRVAVLGMRLGRKHSGELLKVVENLASGQDVDVSEDELKPGVLKEVVDDGSS